MRSILRTLPWLAFAAFLVGLGWTIYQVLPARPRWVVEGNLEIQGFLPDSSATVFRENPRQVTVRDLATGAIRTSVRVAGEPDFTRDYTRWLWLDGEATLAGFDLRTGTEWRLPTEDTRKQVQISDDGEIAAFRSDAFIYTIQVPDGQILDKIERGPIGFDFKATFTADFVIVPARDRDLRIWDRRKRAARSVPIQCEIATISPAGNALLVEYRTGGPFTLVDFPDLARPTDLGLGTAEFTPDGEYLMHSRHVPPRVDSDTRCIEFWDVADRRVVTTLTGIQAGVNFIFHQHFSANGRLLFAYGGDDLVVYELPGGNEIWRWKGTSEPKTVCYHKSPSSLVALPLFRDMGGILTANPVPGALEIRDAASGESLLPHRSLPAPTVVEVHARDNDRHAVLAHVLPEDKGSFTAVLKKWLPEGWVRWDPDRLPYQVAVVDVEKAAFILEGVLHLRRNTVKFLTSDDGRSLVVTHGSADSSARTVECWDIPFARPWHWIIGIPAGIGVSVLAWQWLRRKRRAAA